MDLQFHDDIVKHTHTPQEILQLILFPHREFVFQVVFVVLVGIFAFSVHLHETKPLELKKVRRLQSIAFFQP